MKFSWKQTGLMLSLSLLICGVSMAENTPDPDQQYIQDMREQARQSLVLARQGLVSVMSQNARNYLSSVIDTQEKTLSDLDAFRQQWYGDAAKAAAMAAPVASKKTMEDLMARYEAAIQTSETALPGLQHPELAKWDKKALKQYRRQLSMLRYYNALPPGRY